MPVQFLVLHMVDDIDDIIEERDIMGDQDEGVLILVKDSVLVDMLFIPDKLVGRPKSGISGFWSSRKQAGPIHWPPPLSR